MGIAGGLDVGAFPLVCSAHATPKTVGGTAPLRSIWRLAARPNEERKDTASGGFEPTRIARIVMVATAAPPAGSSAASAPNARGTR